MTLKVILGKIEKKLREKERVREEIQNAARNATRLSKQAIQFIHLERFNDAKSKIKEAKIFFAKIRERTNNYPEFYFSGFVETAFEENAEAQILLRLIEEDGYITPEELDVPEIPYTLSLGDVIGELRRRVLNSIRQGNIEIAEKSLEQMEYIYSELTSLDDCYIILKGLRRKCDVARHLIEITRGDVAIEVRRNALEKSILRLEKIINEQNKD